MEIGRIIGLKQSGQSNREVARQTGNDRKTVSQVWGRYKGLCAELGKDDIDLKEVQRRMTEAPKRASREGVRTKYTQELEELLQRIVESEKGKSRKLGLTHKQPLSNLQIHELVVSEGYDVSRALINAELAKLRRKAKACYIAQEYDLGDRMEYDFGEVKIDCGKGYRTYHMAVFSSPGGKWRWAFLYTNQKIGVFLDSHVKMFELLGGVCREVVYDNMRNVVTKFLGHSEKQLNKELVAIATYYGYIINVTNCYSGNEKGHVESSVKYIRNRYFTKELKFASLDAANEYLNSKLTKDSEKTGLEAEKAHMLPYKPPYELGIACEPKVNSMGLISVDTCKYSVPDRLVGKKVFVKKYHDEIRVYDDHELICKHKRIFGNGNVSIDIYHYLDTLLKKPGAVRNSVALKSIPKLKAIFDTHFAGEPKKFIELFIEHREKSVDEIVQFFEEYTKSPAAKAIEVIGKGSGAVEAARANAAKYAEITFRGDKSEAAKTAKEEAA